MIELAGFILIFLELIAYVKFVQVLAVSKSAGCSD